MGEIQGVIIAAGVSENDGSIIHLPHLSFNEFLYNVVGIWGSKSDKLIAVKSEGPSVWRS